MASQQRRSCAYCGGAELTREHLIPQGYFDRTGEARDFVANIKAGTADKILSIEPTIADVCGRCNNGVLSRLDSYFLATFDRFFTHVVVSGEQISLDFDFDELLRWLLKMGYNMGRARTWDGIHNLAVCTDYIRFGKPRPIDITVLVQATPPGLIPSPHPAELATEIFTVNAMRIPQVAKNFAFVLHVGIHCYQFYILWHHSGTNGFERKIRGRAFQRMFRGTYEVYPRRPVMKIYPSSTTLWNLLNGPLWNAGWGQHLRHHFNRLETTAKG
jgi:hypothetical protein